MNRWSVRLILILIGMVALPYTAPAPLVYRPGEGWTYERPGTDGAWTRDRAEDQVAVAQEAYDNGDYRLALKAARRVVRMWPLSDFAPQAQYLIGLTQEARRQDEKAFKAYQDLLEKYPRIENYDEVLQRQHDIATRYLNGQWFRLWGYIPFFPSMDKTADMYAKIIQNGPYSEVAPEAQMNIGRAREQQSEYMLAVRAYERAADRYHDHEQVAADALYKAGMAYNRQARTAEYDQHVAVQAIATFTDFITLYPNDPRVAETQDIIASLRSEQARGSMQIARFYEKRKRWEGALIYYNEVLIRDPESPLADEARHRIENIRQRLP
jgi:outer membrane protein assembly factor BamD